jgi:hypothetical protein
MGITNANLGLSMRHTVGPLFYRPYFDKETAEPASKERTKFFTPAEAQGRIRSLFRTAIGRQRKTRQRLGKKIVLFPLASFSPSGNSVRSK